MTLAIPTWLFITVLVIAYAIIGAVIAGLHLRFNEDWPHGRQAVREHATISAGALGLFWPLWPVALAIWLPIEGLRRLALKVAGKS